MATTGERAEKLVVDSDIDGWLVRHFHDLCQGGHPANRGETMMAALRRFAVEFVKSGGRRLPRGRRCVKNWKRRCPPRSPRRRDLKRPLSGVSRHWHVLRVPQERARRSKVLAAKDSVES